MPRSEKLSAYYDANVADKGRRLPLPESPRFPRTIALSARIDANHWPHTETFPGPQDRDSFEQLRKTAPGVAEVVVRTMAVFLGADEIVLDGLKCCSDPHQLEIEAAMARRKNQEVTHSLVYSILVDGILDRETAARARDLDATAGQLASLRNWMASVLKNAASYEQQLALGIFEVTCFAALFTVPHGLKKTDTMPTFNSANQLISRDEEDHMNQAAAQVAEIFADAPLELRAEMIELVRDMLREACQAVDPMLSWVFGNEKVNGVGYKEAMEWTKYVCNRFMGQVNLDGKYSDCGGNVPPWPDVVVCPLPWMEMLSVTNTRGNMFEITVMTYDKSKTSQTMLWPSAEETAKHPSVQTPRGVLKFTETELQRLGCIEAVK